MFLFDDGEFILLSISILFAVILLVCALRLILLNRSQSSTRRQKEGCAFLGCISIVLAVGFLLGCLSSANAHAATVGGDHQLTAEGFTSPILSTSTGYAWIWAGNKCYLNFREKKTHGHRIIFANQDEKKPRALTQQDIDKVGQILC